MENRLTKPVIEGMVTKTGYTIDVLAVPYVMVETMRQEIKEPPVPVIINKSKGTQMENPQDPNYIRQLNEVEAKREARVKDAALAFGVRIIEPSVPEDATWVGAKFNVPAMAEWLPAIQDMEMMAGVKILDDFDITDDRDVKILFVKYAVLANPGDLTQVLRKSIGLWDAAQVSLDSFRNKAIR